MLITLIRPRKPKNWFKKLMFRRYEKRCIADCVKRGETVNDNANVVTEKFVTYFDYPFCVKDAGKEQAFDTFELVRVAMEMGAMEITVETRSLFVGTINRNTFNNPMGQSNACRH